MNEHRLFTAYLLIEKVMMALDDVEDPQADILREAMDRVWLGLTDDDRAFLNRRNQTGT